MNTVGKPGQLGELDPLRRLGLDAHRGLGRQHRHPRPRRPRLRHAAPVRAGHRPRAAPPVLRPERRGPVQRRIRRHLRHSVRLHRQAGRRPAAAAARDDPGQGHAPRARRAGDPLPARRGLPRRAARGTADGRVQRRLDPRADARPGRPVDHAELRHHRRGRRPRPRSTWATCGPPRCSSTSPSACSTPSGAIPARSRSSTCSASSSASPSNGSTPISSARAAPTRRSSCIRSWPTWPATGSPPASRAASSASARSRRCSIPTTRPAPPRTSASTPRKTDRWETDARPLPHQLGRFSTATGRPSSAASPSRIPACAPTSRTTTSASKCPIATAPRRGKYLPDFIVLVDDGHGDDDLLHLVVEIKGYRREDAKEKKSTMDTYWVPGVNHLGTYGRWAFAEFTEVYSDRGRLQGEGRKRIQQDDRRRVAAQPVASRRTEHGEEAKPARHRRPSRRSRTTTRQAEEHPDRRVPVGDAARTSRSPMRVAYERRNRDLDPQLVWRGKDEQDWSDLVVHAPPLYIQEKVHPKVLIDDLLRQTRGARARGRRAAARPVRRLQRHPEGRRQDRVLPARRRTGRTA